MGIRTSHTGPADFDRRARLLGYAFSLRRLQKRSHSAKTTWMTFPWMPVIKEEAYHHGEAHIGRCHEIVKK